MHRPALSLTNGILYTALALLALFIVGAIMMNGDAGDTGEPGESGEMMEEGGAMSKAPARPTGASSAAAVPAPAPAATCGQKNDECVTQDDCCGNMGLECKQVRTTSGGFAKKCMPVEVMVCKIDCGEDGLWSATRACRTAVAPKEMWKCQDYVGEPCKASVHEDRNSKECTDT